MRRWKLLAYSLLICLPAVLIIGGALFLSLAVYDVPGLIRYEPTRVTRAYHAVADDLYRHPRKARHFGERRRNWVKSGVVKGSPWGRVVDGDTVIVWVHPKGKRCRWVTVPAIRERPYFPLFVFGGGLVALTLIGLTFLAVWNFVRFMKERDDFLAATAHDLTTPLVGMRMVIGRNDEEAKALNERMIRLVDNIKDFLKLGGRRKKPEIKEFDVVAAYKEAYSLFSADYRDLFDGEDIPVSLGTDPVKSASGGGFRVLADETMTVQILWNLLGNDLKYAAPYGKVAVRFSRAGGFVHVAFVDEGQGMTPRQMRKAFDRYYRAKTVLLSGKGGFGIGLCTAKEFAAAMGGSLEVRANEPHGCIFTLSLPAAI